VDAFLQHFSSSRDSITAAWLFAARTSLDLPTRERVPTPQLLDHLPNLYDDLTEFLRGGEPTDEANLHSQLYGSRRWTKHFRLDELLRELLLLRSVVLREIDLFQASHVPPLPGPTEHLMRERVTYFFDQMAVVSASQFSADHQAETDESHRSLAVRHQAAKTSAAELQVVDAARLRLLRVISHELRNLVNSASLSAETLRTEDDHQARDEMHAAQARSHQQMAALINQLLDVAPLLSGHESLQLARLDHSRFVREECFQLERMAAAKELGFRCKLTPDLGEVVSDEPKLRRVVTNLVQNAIKFTDSGSVGIELTRVEQSHWQLHVSDTGRGIPPEHQDKIFEEFHRIPGFEHHEGTRLGLSIVKHLVQMLGGEIRVKSQLGQGSSFYVLFPSEVA
jgi:signal transduction histidine kinase